MKLSSEWVKHTGSNPCAKAGLLKAEPDCSCGVQERHTHCAGCGRLESKGDWAAKPIATFKIRFSTALRAGRRGRPEGVTMKAELTVEQIERINQILGQWHEAGRAHFERAYQTLDYDSPAYAKTAKVKVKYIYLDDGSSGAFIADRATGTVWPIKSKYGVPNKQRPIGNLWNGLDGGNLNANRWR